MENPSTFHPIASTQLFQRWGANLIAPSFALREATSTSRTWEAMIACFAATLANATATTFGESHEKRRLSILLMPCDAAVVPSTIAPPALWGRGGDDNHPLSFSYSNTKILSFLFFHCIAKPGARSKARFKKKSCLLTASRLSCPSHLTSVWSMTFGCGSLCSRKH